MPGLSSIPETYVWPDVHGIPTVEATGPNAVPIIDLAAPDAVELLGQACEAWGAFQVTNHGVPMQLIEKLDTQARRLFALPMEQKLKTAPPPGVLEGFRIGMPIYSSFFSKKLWNEIFTIKGSPYKHALMLWPEDPSQFSDVAEEFVKEMDALTVKLVDMTLLSLGLSAEDIEQCDQISFCKGKPATIMDLNWYPTCPEPDQTVGLGDHSDSGLITVLYNPNPGLQLLRGPDHDGPSRWVTIPSVPGALVVIVGDMGHILSNGRFANVVHRVIVHQDIARLSTAFQQVPPDNTILSPIVGGFSGQPVYRAVTWREFHNYKMKVKKFEKVLPLIKVTGDENGKDKSVSVAGSIEGESKEGSES